MTEEWGTFLSRSIFSLPPGVTETWVSKMKIDTSEGCESELATEEREKVQDIETCIMADVWKVKTRSIRRRVVENMLGSWVIVGSRINTWTTSTLLILISFYTLFQNNNSVKVPVVNVHSLAQSWQKMVEVQNNKRGEQPQNQTTTATINNNELNCSLSYFRCCCCYCCCWHRWLSGTNKNEHKREWGWEKERRIEGQAPCSY